MLEQVSRVIAYLIGLRKVGQYEKAGEEIELAYMQYVGMSGRLFDLMPTENIIELLNLSQPDWIRVAITANLMLEEARSFAEQGDIQKEQIKGRKACQLMFEAKRNLDSDNFDPEFLDLKKFVDYFPDIKV